MEVKSTFPLVEKYRDYRRFLKDYYEFKKSRRSGFSFRQFSQNAGLKSPNYLQLVMRGERNLSVKIADQVAEAMDLTVVQKKYFVSLVKQENANTDDELYKAQSESLESLKKLVSKYIQKESEIVLSEWHFLLIRELVALSSFEPTGEYVAKKLRNLITASQASKALTFLLSAGFLKEDSGQWKISDPILDSGDTLFSDLLIKKYHAQNLKLWSENLNLWKTEDLEMGILNLSLPASKIPELKEKMRNFQDHILGWLQDEKSVDSVVQVGVYLIPHVIESNSKNK